MPSVSSFIFVWESFKQSLFYLRDMLICKKPIEILIQSFFKVKIWWGFFNYSSEVDVIRKEFSIHVLEIPGDRHHHHRHECIGFISVLIINWSWLYDTTFSFAYEKGVSRWIEVCDVPQIRTCSGISRHSVCITSKLKDNQRARIKRILHFC